MKEKPIVFLIEDDCDDQYIFKMVVKELGIDIEIVTFEDGLSGYQALLDVCSLSCDKSNSLFPDLILLDLNLPVWDGKKTLAEIKKDQRLKKVPVVIYTTSKSEYDRSECYNLGANSFISKEPEYSKLQHQIDCIFNYWLNVVSL